MTTRPMSVITMPMSGMPDSVVAGHTWLVCGTVVTSAPTHGTPEVGGRASNNP